MEQRSLSLKLSAVYIDIYGVLACFYPFLTVYFQQRGLSFTEMGIAFALVSLTSVIAQPVWGFVADKYSNKRTILLITLFFSALVVYSLVLASDFYFVIGSIVLVMAFQSPVVPVADAYCYALIKQYSWLQYGRIRMMGSLGYAVIVLLLGWIVKYFGINSVYFAYSIISLCGMFLVLGIDFKDKVTRQTVKLQDVANLLRNKKVLLLLLAIVFTNIAIGSNSSYISILIEQTGGDVAQIGIVWFIVAISELPVLFVGAKLLRNYGELNLYLVGLSLYVVRYLLDSFCTWYVSVAAIQLMQGITYTFFLVASLEYLNRIAPGKIKTVAMTLHAASIAIGGVIGNLGGGILLEYVNIFVFYKVVAVVCLLGMGFLVGLKKIDMQASGETAMKCSRENAAWQQIKSLSR
ncbi:MAG: transporter [Firmicutes bacterium]|nr:transporter [Bacillota bacterium]